MSLDKEFENVDNELYLIEFKNVVKRWLKIKRSKLKARYMAKKKICLINIELVHCERLKVYWSKPMTIKKVEQMSNYRSEAKNLMNVRRSEKVRKKTRLVVGRLLTPPHYFNDYQILIVRGKCLLPIKYFVATLIFLYN